MSMYGYGYYVDISKVEQSLFIFMWKGGPSISIEEMSKLQDSIYSTLLLINK